MARTAITEPLVVAAHDAGGAEVVSSWIRRHWNNDVHLFAEGPAEAIFARKLPNLACKPRRLMAQHIRGSQSLLTGTSWGSDIELDAITAAKSCGIRSVAFVDHWVNYPLRFSGKGPLILPDQIWVGDPYALIEAKRHFPEEIIYLEPNPYFADIQDEFSKLPNAQIQDGRLRILYVAEPIAEHFGQPDYRHLHPGYDEFDALRNFLGRISATKSPELLIRFRRHPSELAAKYDSVLREFSSIGLHYSAGTTLVEDCAWADWVVGCESMALVIGLLAGKRAFTCIPARGRPCQLPQQNIQVFDSGSIALALAGDECQSAKIPW